MYNCAQILIKVGVQFLSKIVSETTMGANPSTQSKGEMPTTPSLEIDPKLKCLGKGVSCTMVKTMDQVKGGLFLEMQSIYTSDDILGQPPTKGNIDENDYVAEQSAIIAATKKSMIGAECRLMVGPSESIKLGGELKINRNNCNMTEYRKNAKFTKIVGIRHTSTHPGSNEWTDSVHYTPYEQGLSEYILNAIGEKQRDEGGSGKPIADLSEDNPVEKLEDYLQDLKKRGTDSHCQKIWQVVANACCKYFQERKYIGYVHSITLGAAKFTSKDIQNSSISAKCGAQENAMELTNAVCQAGYHKVDEKTFISKETTGELSEDGSCVNTEEIIEVTNRPVYDLITQKELTLIMKNLLSCYAQSKEDTPLGPFKISCRENLDGNEQEIYWKVSSQGQDLEIHGTTSAKEASIFYIKHDGDRFHIIHRRKVNLDQCHGTEYFVYPGVDQPLTLKESTDNIENIQFTLKNNVNKEVAIPQTTADWMQRSPFFIKRPQIGIHIPFTTPSVRILYITKHDEPDLPEYTVTSTDKEDATNRLMLFYFKPTIDDCKLPVHVTLPAKRIEVDSSASPPPPPLLPTAEDKLPGQPADSLDNEQLHIENDSNPIKTELLSEREQAAFFELVGKEYTFPLQMNAQEI